MSESVTPPAGCSLQLQLSADRTPVQSEAGSTPAVIDLSYTPGQFSECFLHRCDAIAVMDKTY